MMQTFLPYPSFRRSAASLDSKRLGKQRVEAKQILIALGVGVGEHEGNHLSRWRHHPAVKMWKWHEFYLAEYAIFICNEWTCRGFKDSMTTQFYEVRQRLLCSNHRNPWFKPEWLGMPDFHASHRSNLLRKLPDHYSRFGWTEADDMEYVWPVS